MSFSLTDLTSWKKLEAHFKLTGTLHMKDLFAGIHVMPRWPEGSALPVQQMPWHLSAILRLLQHNQRRYGWELLEVLEEIYLRAEMLELENK